MTDHPAALSQNAGSRNWAEWIARGYAAKTVPPLTDDMQEGLASALGQAGFDRPVGDPLDDAAIERLNQALDAFELDLDAVVGPRLDTIAPDGTLAFRQRSEAGRPLRAYGGQ